MNHYRFPLHDGGSMTEAISVGMDTMTSGIVRTPMNGCGIRKDRSGLTGKGRIGHCRKVSIWRSA